LSRRLAAGQDRAMDSAAPWSPWTTLAPPLVRNLLGFAVFCVVYLGAYRFGMAFSPAVSAPFWFPDSVLLCALLCTRTSRWWVLLLAILPIRLIHGDHPGVTTSFLLSVWVNDSLKGVLAAWLLRRYLRDPIRLDSMRDLGVFAAIAVVLVPALSAFAGAASRAMAGHEYWPSFEQWFLGDAMAQLIVTPILFYWVLRPPRPSTFQAGRVIEAGILAIGLLVTLSWAFEPVAQPRDLAETRFYAPVPFMVWAAIRFRMPGATGAVALLTIFAVHAAITGTGSFANQTPAGLAYHLQHFLLLRVAPLYLVAVLLEQWVRVSDSLRESEQRFRNIANQAPMMTWTSDPAGGCEFSSQQWLQFAGRPLEQTLGAGWADALHPDDRQRAYDAYMECLGRRARVELEYRARRHDGEYRWVHVHGMPRFGASGEFMGYVGSIVDITERHQQEAALRRSEARYRDVVESQANFVCRFLPDGTLTFVNTTFCRFLGRGRLDLLGGSFFDLLPPVARPAARAAVEQALAVSGQAAWESEHTNDEAARGWHSWVCHVIEGPPDEIREIQVIGSDVTDRKRAEESGRQLAHAARFAALGELTAMVAHEINQPLCAILSNAEAAEIMLRTGDPSKEELRQILEDIRNDDLRADAAIRSIRSLLNRREFQPRPMDVVETIEHVLKLVAGDAMHRRVVVRRELAESLPMVIGDRSQVEQVLVILIVNAMDAMKETAEGARKVLVSARVDGSFVEVAVRDHGHGIAIANLPQLFDSFYTTKADGMGLGLSIARTMIAAHGGRIWAENAPGGGAIFRFTLRSQS
jgi:PAS domain S-box-containing protein